MITLFQFNRTWGLPNLGQFNVKVETYLRMAELPYEIQETMPLRAPKGKLPFIKDDNQSIADSTLIIEYLKRQYGDPLDQHLTEQQKAQSIAIQRLLEDHLYWVGMYTRWLYTDENWQINKQAIFGSMPPVVRDIVAAVYRRTIIAKQIHGHGLGRHSAEEIFNLGKTDLDALSILLADQDFFLGSKPTTIDASAFGLLINTLYQPIESPVKQHGLNKNNLNAYCLRMMKQFFPELGDEFKTNSE